MVIFKTERLNIRRFTKGDWQSLYTYLSDQEVVQYEPYPPLTVEQAKEEAARREQDDSFYAVCLPDGTLIGNLYLAPGDFDTGELGYVFNRNYWGLGYAAESVAGLIHHAFTELNMRRIVAMCNPENTASWKLLERVGMRREGHLKKNIYFFVDSQGHPIWQDTYEYGLLKEEYSPQVLPATR